MTRGPIPAAPMPRVAWAVAAAGLALGLWVSLHYAFATWSTESDAADPYLLWEGVRQYGPRFLTSFHYAPDNWLTWPMPLLFAAFAVFGDAPPVAFAVGWRTDESIIG